MTSTLTRGRPVGSGLFQSFKRRAMSPELQEGGTDFVVLRGERGEGELRAIYCNEEEEAEPCWEASCRCGGWQILTHSAGAAARWLEQHWMGGCGP